MMLGGIAGVQPTEVVVIGAGTVGEFATRAALGLGASVKVFDNSLSKLRRLQNDVGARVYTSILQPKVLAKAIRRADVVIGALRSPIGRSLCVVSEEMIESMKSGSVVVDLSIDQGCCFETSRVTNHNDPTFVKNGVTRRRSLGIAFSPAISKKLLIRERVPVRVRPGAAVTPRRVGCVVGVAGTVTGDAPRAGRDGVSCTAGGDAAAVDGDVSAGVAVAGVTVCGAVGSSVTVAVAMTRVTFRLLKLL
jgi:hypothetical protein